MFLKRHPVYYRYPSLASCRTAWVSALPNSPMKIRGIAQFVGGHDCGANKGYCDLARATNCITCSDCSKNRYNSLAL
jgi:hypothetical protein